MTTRVIRELPINGATLGVVLVDDRWFGWSLEDTLREKPGQPVSAWKVPGETAIPAGRYRLAVTRSTRFGRLMPEVLDVPGFEGIRIHAGNVAGDTEGCLLFGKARAVASVQQSRVACDQFQDVLTAALSRGEACWLSVENPLSWGGA